MAQNLNKKIRTQVAKVILGIVTFLFIYVCLLYVSCVVFYHTFIFWMQGHDDSLMAAIIAIASGIFILNLVMFLFKFKRNKRTDRVRVTEKDCPALFAAIKDLVKTEGCKMPKKVFVSPDVNACVFYNTYFWNIFIPVRKNLEVGAGLLAMTNVDELRGILAHEFGHFSQKSMKVGSAIGVTNQIIFTLAEGNGPWDKFVAVCMKTIGRLHIFTWLICVAVFGLTIAMEKFFRMLSEQINMANNELSRQMEFEADSVAASVVGSNVFASGLRKIPFLSNTHSNMLNMATSLAQEGKRITDLFQYHQMVTELIAKDVKVSIACDHLLDADIAEEEVKSKISFTNMWADHPSQDDRLKNLPSGNDKPFSKEPSMTLIPVSIREELSSLVYENAGYDVGAMTTIEGDELTERTQKYIDDSIPTGFVEFFNHYIGPFELKPEDFAEVSNPFTNDNRKILKTLVTAQNDLALLNGIYYGNVKAKDIIIEGEKFTKDELPITCQSNYVDELAQQVRAIDYNVIQYTYNSYRDYPNTQAMILRSLNDLFALNHILATKEKEMRDCLEVHNPSRAEDAEDAQNDREVISLTANHIICDIYNCLLGIVGEPALESYKGIAFYPDSYDINQHLQAITSMLNTTHRVASFIEKRLGKLFCKVSAGDIHEES